MDYAHLLPIRNADSIGSTGLVMIPVVSNLKEWQNKQQFSEYPEGLSPGPALCMVMVDRAVTMLVDSEKEGLLLELSRICLSAWSPGKKL